MRRRSVLALVAILSLAAEYRTPNFIVRAASAEIAESVGQWAEHYRREKAQQWLGQEMPTWSQPCPLVVKVSPEGPSGATSFNFGQGRVLGQSMQIEGPLQRLIYSVLPHEITHTVFAYYFRTPVPRWADEGGSVLSEDDIERERHDKLTRDILNNQRQIPMRTLFGLKQYPRDVICLYAQGYSISNYLVNRSSKLTFLQFVMHGMDQGWDNAVWTFYRHRNVDELEEAWLKHLRDTKGQPHLQQVAQGQVKPEQPTGQSQTVVRLTVPPQLLSASAPVIRAQSPGEGDTEQQPFVISPTSRQQFLPEASRPALPRGWPGGAAPAPAPAPAGTWQPAPVTLGAPEFGASPGVGQPGAPVRMSPAGFPQR